MHRPTADRSPSEPRLHLGNWVTLAIVSAVLLTTLALLAVLDSFAQSYARKETEERLKQLAWQMRDTLNRGLAERQIDMQVIAGLEQITDAVDPAHARNIFNSLQKAYPHYAWIGLAELDGKVFAATRGLLEGKQVDERPWFQQGRKTLSTGDYHPAVLLQQKLPDVGEPWRFVDISLPVYRADGQVRGVLGAHLSWSWARELGRNLFGPTKTHYAAEVLIVRNDSQVLLGPQDMLEKPLQVGSLTQAMQGRTGAALETWPDGKRYFTGFVRQAMDQPGASLGWTILVRQPESIAMAAFDALQQRVLLTGGLLCLGLALMSALLIRKLPAPLNTLTKAISGGDWHTSQLDIPQVGVYKEAWLLSRTLARLVDNERQQSQQLQQLNTSLEQKVAERTTELQTLANDLGNALVVQQNMQRTLQQSEAELKAILHNAHEAFVAIDHSGCIVEWNPQAEALFGWPREQALGQQLEQTIIPQQYRASHNRGLAEFLRSGHGPMLNQRLELSAQKRNGDIFPVEFSIGHVAREQGHLFIAFMQDISVRKAMQHLLESQVFEDTLTRLPNRRAFLKTLPEAMARARRSNSAMAVMFLDLDGFKAVNDLYGHDSGDEVLREFARRIVNSVRSTDSVARLAGDEFTVILEGLQQPEADAAQLGQKILLAAQRPFELAQASVTLSSSIGIALFHPDATFSADLLLQQADQAMYAAKRAGKNQWRLADRSSTQV